MSTWEQRHEEQCGLIPRRTRRYRSAAPFTLLRALMPKAKPAAKAAPGEVEALDFEQALASLEKLVAELEAGDQPLEQALASFEQGVALTRRCQAALRSAEQKVAILTRDADDAELQPFEPER